MSIIISMLMVAMSVGMVFIIADRMYEIQPDAPGTFVLGHLKFRMLLGYSVFGFFTGALLRWKVLKNVVKSHWVIWRERWFEITKIGTASASLTFAALSGVVAVFRELASISATLASAEGFLMAMILSSLIIVATYIAAKKIIFEYPSNSTL